MEALALGKRNHAALAEGFERSVQAIRQFSARNSAEIASRRQVLLGELDAETAHSWVANKVARIDWYQKLIEDLEIRLADEDLDPSVRSRFTRDVAQLLRAVAEEKGELRTQVDVDAGPRLVHTVVGWDIEKWAAGQTDPSNSEPDGRGSAPTSARTPASPEEAAASSGQRHPSLSPASLEEPVNRSSAVDR